MLTSSDFIMRNRTVDTYKYFSQQAVKREIFRIGTFFITKKKKKMQSAALERDNILPR